jgi:hypothetical protein
MKRQRVLRRKKGQYEVEVIVVKDLSIPILLGFPAMEEMGVIINTKKGTVSFGKLENEVVVKYKGREEDYVMTVEETIIAPSCMDQAIKVMIDRKNTEGEGLFSIEEIIGIPGLIVEEGLVDEKTQVLKISNYTGRTFKIGKGYPLGIIRKAVWREEEMGEDEVMNVEEGEGMKDTSKEEEEFREDRKKALSGKGISNEGKREIRKVINEFQESFKRKVVYDESKSKLEPYSMRMKADAQPVIEAMNRANPERREIEEKLTNDLFQRGFIEEGQGANRSRLLLVKKSDGTWRTVIDYRKINAQMIPDSYPMPRIDEMLDNLSGAKYFSKLDMTDGFWQIGLDEKSREWTGFATRSRFWRWKVFPMGIMNSPSAFQRAMDKVLGELKWKCVMCYVDDLIIYSETLEEHVRHIRQVLERLAKAGIYAKLAKCQFGVEELKFLGHIVGKEGMKPDPEKTTAVEKMPVPKDAKGVSRFLGMAGFYRKYIRNFSSRTINLRELTRKEKIFEWKEECQKEFEDIKKALTSSPVMTYPNFGKKFIVSTDASYQGLGATLSQMGSGGESDCVCFKEFEHT